MTSSRIDITPPASLSKAAFLVVMFGMLAGCMDNTADTKSPFTGFMNAANTGPNYKRAIRQTSLAGGVIVLPAPTGFCIDPKTLRRGGGNSFAILASCAALGAGPDFDASVFTVTVSPRQPGLTSPGLGALVQATKSQGILAQQNHDGIAIVQLAKGGNKYIQQADTKHWRAAFVLNERVVGLSAFGRKDSLLTRSSGGKALERLAQAIRKQSPDSAGFSLFSGSKKPALSDSELPAAETKATGLGEFLKKVTAPKPKPAENPKTTPTEDAKPKKGLGMVIGRLFQRSHLAKE